MYPCSHRRSSYMAVVWILTVFVIMSACWIPVLLGSCSAGKFGDSCDYSCHCGHACNRTTGVCGGDCDRGWVGGKGRTCQKKNAAYGKHASSPTRLWADTYSADKAVDGNRDQDVRHGSCFNTYDNVPSVWKVDLGDRYRIHDVRIYHEQSYLTRIRTADIYLSNTSTTPSVPCYSFPSNTPDTANGIYDVVCDGIGRYFTITDPTHLNLCEVEIYVCSPGVFGDSCNQFCHCLQATCDPVSGLCPGDCRPGWRGDRCDTECDADHYGVNCVNTCSDRKCSDVTSSCDRHSGSCDKGCLPGWRGVDCTQDCSFGRYGQNCNDSCSDRKCAGDSPCDHVGGACVYGCAPGWMGGDCRGVCSNGSYGQNCNNSCTDRKCAGFSPCDHVRGTCVSGCEQGWMGEDCRVCHLEHYGTNCDKACASRHCRGNSSCNSDGTCDSGCETGWTHNDCTEEAEILQCTGGNVVHLAVAVAVAFLVGVVVGAVVCFLVWGKRNRRPHKTSESPPVDASNARIDQSQNSDDVGPDSRTYDSLHAESPDDARMTGEAYCTIKSVNTDSEACAATSRNLSEPVGAQVYENIDHTSREKDGAYSELGN